MISKSEFEAIFRANYKDLLNYAFIFTNSLFHSEEVVQEVFVSFWENRDKIIEIRSVKSYLMGAVKYRSLNLKIRQLNKHHFTDIEDLQFLQCPDDTETDKELNYLIRKSIKDLPEECRKIFLLSRFTSLTYIEIAEHLGISVKTVETQVSIALKKLRASVRNTQILLFLI